MQVWDVLKGWKECTLQIREWLTSRRDHRKWSASAHLHQPLRQETPLLGALYRSRMEWHPELTDNISFLPPWTEGTFPRNPLFWHYMKESKWLHENKTGMDNGLFISSIDVQSANCFASDIGFGDEKIWIFDSQVARAPITPVVGGCLWAAQSFQWLDRFQTFCVVSDEWSSEEREDACTLVELSWCQ